MPSTIWAPGSLQIPAYPVLSAVTGAGQIGWKQKYIGAIPRTVQDELYDRISVKQFGILDDGSDQTAALVAFFTNNPTLRGIVVIPYGVKFDIPTVYPSAPTGVMVQDDSSINTGQPPGYKNKSRVMFTNDNGADDMYTGFASSHHPALRLNNTHTSGTDSANKSYHSIIFSHGHRWNKDLIDGMQYLTSLSPRGSMWRSSWVVNTKYLYAANPAPWVALTVYALNAIVNTDDGNVYQASIAGVSGAAKPVHTAGTAVNGSVTWQYLGKWSVGQTLFYFDEDGYGALSGQISSRLGVETATKKGVSLNAVEASGDTFLRDDQRNIDFWRLSTANGLQSGALQSMGYSGDLVGATPALSTNFHAVNNLAATNMTNMLLPAGQIRAGIVYLYFKTALTTLMNAGGNFNLKNNVNVTPAAGSIMGFLLEPNLSGGWIEVSRNF